MLLGFTLLSFDQFLFFFVLALCYWMYLGQKFLAGNPGVKSAAKKAVATKAVDLIGKWLR